MFGLILILIVLFIITPSIIVFFILKNKINTLELKIQALENIYELETEKDVPQISASSSEFSNTEHNTNDAAINEVTTAQSSIEEKTKENQSRHAASEIAQKVAFNEEKTATSKESSLSYRLFQWLIKGNPIAKVAIIILFFGLSYLLKYSIDHALLPPEIRILGVLLLSIILLAIGWRLREKKELYALILQGGGIGALYLTLFAAFKLYALVPALFVFALLVVVCASSVALAVLQRAISLAILACIGGYLAPILLSTGSGNHIALFSYYLLISTAILVISFWQSWRILNLIGFLFTFVVAILWGAQSFKAEFYLECQIFILANMIIYGVLAVLLSVRNTREEPYQEIFDLILLFSVPLTAFYLQYEITQQWQYAPAFSALGFGLFYLLGSFIILRIWKGRAKKLALYGLAIGISFTTLAVPLALGANWTALIWLLEGSVISYAALSQKQYRFGWIGSLIVLLGAISAVISEFSYLLDGYISFVILYGMMSAILLFNACLWHYYRALDLSATAIKIIFVIVAGLSWSVWIIDGAFFMPSSSTNTIQLMIACYILSVWIWFAIGYKMNWSVLRAAVIILWPVLLCALIYNFLCSSYSYAYGIGVLSWIAAFASAYAYLYLNKTHLENNNKPFALALHISLLWLILAWLYYEISGWLSFFLPWGFETIEWSIFTATAGIIILTFYLLEKYHRFPIKSNSETYWKIGLFPLGAYLLFQLIIGLYSDGSIRHWTYVPFINPLEETAAFALMMLAIYLHKLTRSLSEQKQQKLAEKLSLPFVLLVISVVAFLWWNSIILRSLSQWLDIPWRFYALWHDSIVQMVLSLIWALTAVILIIIAHRYASRTLWFLGTVIQIIIVIKLVFVDSIELDGLIRAFVFIGVALLMLVIGYLLPLPPKAKDEE